MSTNGLVDLFCNWDISALSEYSELISTKDENGIFPPYVPFAGKNYDIYRIFVYAMAQNEKHGSGYLNAYTRIEKVRRLQRRIDIAPLPVLYALVGIYLYAKFRIRMDKFTQVEKHIAVTNYYKFSLNNGRRDLNPNHKLPNPQNFWKLNDALSLKELEFRKPRVIICFNGRHIQVLKQAGFSNLAVVNDPSWILQGACGCLKKSGSWYRELKDTTAVDLIAGYITQIDERSKRYASKREAVQIYLSKYCCDWTNPEL